MRALLHTEFDSLLARAGASQASFARLTGVTARQVNNWARGRALVLNGPPCSLRRSRSSHQRPDDLT
jgi:DNA-binding transcriptional regulator YiaG